MLTARYIDPTTDFGFKRLCGREASKDMLKVFLHDMLELPYPLHELTAMPQEQGSPPADQPEGKDPL